LSTFNGEAYLQAQLDSLYAQTYPRMRILARDDGSSDATPAILERARAAGRIDVVVGNNNLGPGLSFFELLRVAAAADTSFVAFCDQDDVWLSEKVERAVAALSSADAGEAALYCSRLEIVDASLDHVGLTPMPAKTGFGNALVENVAVGCTIVLNRRAIDLVAGKLPASVLIHDWWCYAVLSCFGKIVFDAQPSIKYRQHGANAFGATSANARGWGRKLRRFSGSGAGLHWQSDQAAVFLESFGDHMPAIERQLVECFVGARVSLLKRFSLAASAGIWRQKPLDDLAQRMLILLNRY